MRGVKELTELRLASLDGAQFHGDSGVKFVGVVRSEVTKSPVLKPTPKRFDRVEHGRVGRQTFQAQAVCVPGEQGADRRAFVHGAAVPKHDQPLAPELGKQPFQEVSHLRVVEIAVDQPAAKQSQALPAWRQPQGRAKRDLLTVAPCWWSTGVSPWGAQVRRRSGAIKSPLSSMSTRAAPWRRAFF